MNNITYRSAYKPWRFIKIAKYTALISIFLSSSTVCKVALADCTYTGDTDIIFDDYRTSNPIIIDSSLPTGATLGSLIVAETSANGIDIVCTTYPVTTKTTSVYPEISPGLFQTGIDGIGMKLISHNQPSGFLPLNLIATGYTRILSGPVYTFIFIKTGYIPAGGQLNPGLFSENRNITDGNSLVASFYIPQPIILNLLRPTCAVNTPNFTVDLGEVNIADFDVSGRTFPKNFSIDLTCTGGTNSADVLVTLTDADNPANATSQLDLSPDSTAQGIALEVNNRFGLVRFGPDLEGVGNPGQWNDGATGEGSYSIPLSVNYVRLPGPIKGGTANSGVTYTLNYD